MRIISGRYRSKRIVAPTNLPARPTTDFAKEALFNILNSRVDFENIKVLDLFTGTGNLSYEFASRGVPSILAIDANHRCFKFVSNTAKELKFESLKVYKSDVFKFLKKSFDSYDLIFADPPYQIDNKGELIDLIFEKNVLKQEGIFILEHPDHDDFEDHPNFEFSRSYSSVNFSFFSHSNNQEKI